MDVLNFIEQFPDESFCKTHLKLIREEEGISCKKCNCKKHYWLKAKYMWQCSECNFRTSLRNGTIMENSKLPIRTWYLAIAFVSLNEKHTPVIELQKQLNHNRYHTIWSLKNRIQEKINGQDNIHYLSAIVEFNESYIEKITAKNEEKKSNLYQKEKSEKEYKYLKEERIKKSNKIRMVIKVTKRLFSNVCHKLKI